ncbi:FxsC protein [Streptomyces sp. MA5143a]|uniref:FxsC protein n=1 Tax=Streptomyces sp. MA5143a TaxID=2083010 RepID=UPI000D1B58DE|nr:FxsC protein [Streptomyces sp. MA5143a]SPE99761.1 hypothetical protein SMA5143A_0470 [Streptomyces sp. MA5143a]
MPKFFVSYARVPFPRRRETAQDPNRLVFQFFDRLLAEVERHDGRGRRSVGFIERPGTSEEKTIEALMDCEVFVPLYSRRYFSNSRCGRQWTAVTQGALRSSPAKIVPVLWTPYPPTSLPRAVHGSLPEVPEGHGAAMEDYGDMGLHQLLDQWNDLRSAPRSAEERSAADLVGSQVSEVVDWLARRIVRSTVSAPPPVSQPPHPQRDPRLLAELDDAFAVPFASPLRITVLAPTEDQLPVGRDSLRYGLRVEDWRPYGPVADPLVEQLEALARNLGFHPTVEPFHKAQEELKSAAVPDAPWVLVVDPWALENREMAMQARKFDTARRPWTAVISTLAADDPQTKEQSDRLRGLLTSCFPRFLNEGREGERAAVQGLDSADAFTRWFSELAESTKIGYLRYIHSQLSQSGGGVRDLPDSGADLPRRSGTGPGNGEAGNGSRVEGTS